MKAFIGHSFDPKDKNVVNEIMTFFPKHGIPCEDAEISENKDISDKIKKKIDRNEIFVGIFTIEQEIKQLNLAQEIPKKSLFEKLGIKKSPQNLSQNIAPIFTTSNWVIQESGYAIGKSKEIILLVERGVYKFPELQGDKEIIPFDRNSLAPALIRLLEIIQDVKLGMKSTGQAVSEEIPEQEKKDDVGEQEKSKGLPWEELIDAHHRGDIVTAGNIYQDKIRSHLKPENVIFWDAVLYRWKYCSGDADALVELTKMAEETKNYDVNKQLASCYDFADDNERARQQFAKCIELTKNTSEKVDCLVGIAMSYAQEKNYDLAIEKLLDASNNSDFNTHLEKIFLKLVEIARMKEDDYLYIMFAEKALNINAVNTTLRFNLGLKYLNTDKNDLAVYHYKKLLDMQESSGSFNNIAIAYADLDMKAKEADCLERAVEKRDDTLPYANIAQKYLDEGFTNDADRLLKEADELGGKKVEVDERVGFVKGKLKKMLEDEDKKEKEILWVAAKIQKFKIRYANAYCLKNTKVNLSEISGIWVTEKWGELDFKFNIAAKTFEVNSQERIEKKTLGFLGSIAFGAFGGSQPLPKEYKIRKIEIKGKINNLAGNYSIRVTEEKETTSSAGLGQTLLGMPSPDELYSANGFLIINDNTTIDILEEDSKNIRFFSHWNKKIAWVTVDNKI